MALSKNDINNKWLNPGMIAPIQSSGVSTPALAMGTPPITVPPKPTMAPIPTSSQVATPVAPPKSVVPPRTAATPVPTTPSPSAAISSLPTTPVGNNQSLYGPPQIKPVVDATGAPRTLATNADGTQTATNSPFVSSQPQGDTFENRSNPNSAWVYYGNGEWRNDKTGESKNTAGAAVPQPAQNTDLLAKWGLSPQEIEKNLAEEKSRISQKYNVLREEEKTKTENERQGNISSYYGAGEVNPLSSGVGNLTSYAGNILTKRLTSLSEMENAEVSDATNRAYGLKTKGLEAERQQQQDQEAQIQQEYTNNRQKMMDDITMASNKQKMSQDEKNASWTRIKDLVGSFGSKAFDGIDETALGLLETSSGIPKGSLTKGLKTVKEQELLGKAMNLKEVDGSLYNVTTDAEGNLKASLVIKGAPKSDTGLTPAQINQTVNQIAGAFDNEPVVKEFNTINAQYKFLTGAGSSPTDDISRVYVFAKVMDPNSVVREGEYKTVQDYSQALLQNMGLKAKRVFDNSGFLTPEARTFMQNTIKRRLDVSQVQYNQVADEYQRQIDDAYTGKPRQITNYGGAFGGQVGGQDAEVRSAYEQAGISEPYDQMVSKYGEQAVKDYLTEQGFISP